MKNENTTEPLTAIHNQVIAAREGRDARVIARLFSGWAVFGERQFVRGYALLLPDPVVPNLNALGARERIAFLSDMSRLGDALLKVTGGRINYDLRNQDPAARVIRLDEPEPRTQQPWAYDWNTALFERGAVRTDRGVLRRLTRLGVTKPANHPGANAPAGLERAGARPASAAGSPRAGAAGFGAMVRRRRLGAEQLPSKISSAPGGIGPPGGGRRSYASCGGTKNSYFAPGFMRPTPSDQPGIT
jgi:hypothetical protein